MYSPVKKIIIKKSRRKNKTNDEKTYIDLDVFFINIDDKLNLYNQNAEHKIKLKKVRKMKIFNVV